MRARQLSFLPPTHLSHGSDLRAGKRKIARPVDPRRPLHIVLRSSRARGAWSFLHPSNKGRVHVLVRDIASKRDIRIHRFANVGNHLHLLIQFRTRKALQAFLRELGGRIATLVTGATKRSPVGRFWDGLAFTRVVNWGRDFVKVGRYLVKNLLEGLGAMNRKGADADVEFLELGRGKSHLKWQSRPG